MKRDIHQTVFFFLTSAADSHLNLSTITRSKPPSIPPQSGKFCFNLLDVSLSVSFSSFAHTDVADLQSAVSESLK